MSSKEAAVTKLHVGDLSNEGDLQKLLAESKCDAEGGYSVTTDDMTDADLAIEDGNFAKKLLHESRCEDGKSVWATTLETYSMHDVKGKRGDFHCAKLEDAIHSLRDMAAKHDMTIDTDVLEGFDATINDLLRVFAKWCFKEESGKYNVSKGFRRLKDYVNWMEKNCKGYDWRPETMIEAHEAWGFFMTYDKYDRLVWWTDCDINDFERIKYEVDHDDTLRYVVYLSHVVMFDKKAQENGIVCIEQMGNKSVMEYLNMIPMDLGAKLDRITVGIIPVKIKKLHFFNCARWMWIIAGLFAPFASSKMRKRFSLIRGNPQKKIDNEVGRECIPTQMNGGLVGMVDTDILAKIFDQNEAK